MSDYDTLYQRVANVLLSNASARMDFWALGMHVSGAGYRVVWYAITQRLIKMQLAVKGVEAPLLPAGTAAFYDPRTHTLHFSLLDPPDYGGWGKEDPLQKMLIHHECTHALRDFIASSSPQGFGSNISQQLFYDNETVAYIAEVVYFFNLTGKDDLAVAEGSPDSDIYSAAVPIARAIKDKPGAYVDNKEFLDLRAVIQINPTYSRDHPSNEPDPARGIF
jgi:hypothetical protein